MLDLKIDVTEVDTCTRKLELELPFSQYQKELEKAYRTLNRKVRVQGFRKGKAPLKVLERYYKDRVETEVLQKLVPESFKEAVIEKNLNAVGQPRLEDFKVEKEKLVKLMLTVEVKPEIDEVSYEGFEFQKTVQNISQENVDKEIDGLREKLAELNEKPDGRIEKGDYATIDYQLFIEGKATPEEKRENVTLAVGDGSLDENFERQLLGMSKGDEKKIVIRFPQENTRPELAGKEAVFRVNIHGVKIKVLPPLDDDLARQLGDYETLEDLKTDIRDKLEEFEEQQATNRLKKDLISKLVEENPVEAPPSLVDEELNLRLFLLQSQLQRQGLRLENLTREDLEKWREENRDDATGNVKANLILEKIAQIKEIEVSDQELNEELKKVGTEAKQDVQTLKKQMEENGRLASLKESVLREKTLNNMLEGYKIEVITADNIDDQAPQGQNIEEEQE